MKLRNTVFARAAVFLKFASWDVFLNGQNMTLKECWVVAGINTTMTKIPPR
jgi:hypothetical protein